MLTTKNQEPDELIGTRSLYGAKGRHARPRVLLIDFSGYGVMTHVLSLLDYADHELWDYCMIHASDDLRPGVDSYRKELADRGIQGWSIPVQQSITAQDGRALLKTMRLIRAIKPDLIHCHSTKAGFVGRLCAVLSGDIPTVFTPHSFSFQMSDPGSRKHSVLVGIERALGQRTKRIAAVSETEQNLAVTHGISRSERALLIRNGVHLGLCDRAIALGKALRPGLAAAGDGPVICFIGRFAPQKMPQLVVETASRLREEGRPATFLFIGNGPQEQEIQDTIKSRGLQDCCIWLGWQPYDQALGYLAAADIMLLPSRYEGLPYVALEAQAVGTVPILTDAPGSSDAVIPGQTAITVPIGDVAAMANAIGRLADDRALLDSMAARGRLFVEEQFSAQNMARSIERMYSSVLAEAGHIAGTLPERTENPSDNTRTVA